MSQYGFTPETISNNIQPKDQMSESYAYGFSIIISGAIYQGVPNNVLFL